MHGKNNMLRAIAGGLLAFYGAKLLGMSLQDRPDNFVLFVAVAIAFIAIGTIYAVNSIKKYIKEMKETYGDSDEDAKGEDESCE